MQYWARRGQTQTIDIIYIYRLDARYVLVSFPDPPIPQRWMYYITSTRKEGLESIARFSCATGMQSNAKSHDTRPHGILISDELASVRL